MHISIQEILTQALGFAILFWIMKKHAWKPILSLLESRREKIVSSFDEIERSKKELEALRTDYEARLAHIEDEARAKLQTAIQEGKQVARELHDSARQQAKEILDKCKHDVELEAAKARVELRKEIAGLVFQVSERLVKEKMTSKKDEEEILKFIQEIEATQGPLIES